MPDVKYELYLGDCLEYMKSMPDKSVDAVITDPPYGVGLDYTSYVDSAENLVGLIENFVPECLRIANTVAITSGVGNIHRYPPSTWTLGWFWKNTTSTGKWGFNCWQPVLVYGKDPQLVSGNGRHQDAKEFPPNDGAIGKFDHPCPKPISVMRWLAVRCSIDGATIFDPFMGSGTTGVACMQLGRNFIGCEIDEGYFRIAEKRIKQAAAQMLLPM